MPQMMYRRDCACDQSGALTGWDTPCGTCGAPAVRHGWHVGMYEAMAQYQRFYGFKPMGNHRAHVDAILGPLCARCTTCDGGGLVDADDTAGWRNCDACEGLGKVWTGTPDVVTAARAEVASRYPDAAVHGGTPHPTSTFVAFNVGSSTIIDLRDAAQAAHDAVRAPSTTGSVEATAGVDAGENADEDDEYVEYLAPVRWPTAAYMRPLTTTDRARLAANDAEVTARIAMCEDAVFADQLRCVQRRDTHADDVAWDLGLGMDCYGVLALNAWGEDEVAEALADENGSFWARAAIFTVHDGVTVAVVTLDDGVGVVEVVGVFKDVREAEWMLERYGTLDKYEWPR